MNQKTKASIELPPGLIEDLKLGNSNDLVFQVVEHGALLTGAHHDREKAPWKPLVITAIVALLVFFGVFFRYKQIPLTGDQSIATVVILLGALTGMTNFTYLFVKNKKSDEKRMIKGIRWRNFPTVFISYLTLMVLSSLLAFKILGELFLGASFDIYTSTVLGTMFVMVINLALIYAVQTLTPVSMIKSLTAIIIGGVTVAMMTNKEYQWWMHNFSFLGTPEARSSWRFNLTLLLSAFLMAALIDYLFVLLYEKLGKTKNLVVFKFILILTAVCLGGVGFFPYDESPFNQRMHNRSAQYLVYMFIILIALLRWLLPQVGKKFLRFSYGIAAALIFSVYLFLGVDYLSLTAFQIFCFVLAFTWLLMLLRILVNMVMNVGQKYDVVLVTESIEGDVQ